MNSRLILVASLISATSAFAQMPENLVADGVPPITPELKADAGRYLEFRAAGFTGWHPAKRELLISTRFADTAQLHAVQIPGGARRQLTFSPEPVSGGQWQPKHGRYIVFMQDKGGGEFYQLFRLDPDEGRITLLTDGKSRNGGPRFTRSGSRIAYTSTRRNGRDSDIYAMDPADPKTDKLIREISGGGWVVSDWSADESIYRLYPTSVPLTEDLTRRGRTEVVDKVTNPPWRPTPAMRERNPEWPEMVPGGDPNNPLGPFALYLSWQYYRIHGTHDTRKIGRRSSNGCVGLYNEHIQELFSFATVGTQVLLI